MSINRYSSVYVYYPRGAATGGPEALHQLVDAIRLEGGSAFLVPIPGTEDLPRAAQFDVYDAPEIGMPATDPDAALVVPEVVPELLWHEPGPGVRMMWWLSVDNSPYFRLGRKVAYARRQRLALANWRELASDGRDLLLRWSSRQLRSPRAYKHVCQSVYAQQAVNSRFGTRATLLSDYVNTGFADPPPEPRATDTFRVAFNPVKGTREIRAVIAASSRQLEWVPIEGMTPADVIRTLRGCDVYVDLGPHPGRDRLPREAALCGCVVIVASRGSAAFDEDVPLPADYKPPATREMVPDVVNLLEQVIADPIGAWQAQAGFRDSIHQGRATFMEEVRGIFFEPASGSGAQDG